MYLGVSQLGKYVASAANIRYGPPYRVIHTILYVSPQQMNFLPEYTSQNDTTMPKSLYNTYHHTVQVAQV